MRVLALARPDAEVKWNEATSGRGFLSANTWTDLTLEGALTAMLTVERLDALNGGPLETVNTVAGTVSVNGNATPAAAGACNIE